MLSQVDVLALRRRRQDAINAANQILRDEARAAAEVQAATVVAAVPNGHVQFSNVIGGPETCSTVVTGPFVPQLPLAHPGLRRAKSSPAGSTYRPNTSYGAGIATLAPDSGARSVSQRQLQYRTTNSILVVKASALAQSSQNAADPMSPDLMSFLAPSNTLPFADGARVGPIPVFTSINANGPWEATVPRTL